MNSRDSRWCTRRDFLRTVGAITTAAVLTQSLPSPLPASTPRRGAEVRARQFHNLVAGSSLDQALRKLWNDVREDTGGELHVTVCPNNGNVEGGDPQALEMMRTGELQFFTLNGAILSNLVAAFDVQTLPVVFGDREEVFRVLDGPIANYLVEQLPAHGIRGFAGALFENGWRHITTTRVPIRSVSDVRGIGWRIPKSELFRDFVASLGAVPLEINLNQAFDAISDGRVEAQDNPLTLIYGERYYELQHFLNLTQHMWAGFNFLANDAFYQSLAPNVRAAIERRLAAAVAAQREAQDRMNRELESVLREKGMDVIETDTTAFAPVLGPFYARRRAVYGEKMWSMLESSLGRPIRAHG